MKREIIFRAKHIHVLPGNEHLDGRWIEGYLCDKNYINSPELEGEFLINENTICQYTGLMDKNNRKIFEGDIVKAIYKPKDEDLTIDDFIIKWDKYYCKFVGYYVKKENIYNPLLFGSQNSFEVIGNIFDNLELLKENDAGI